MEDQQTKTGFFIYDPRYLDDSFEATLFEACDTIEEARKKASGYGNNNVIVETTFHRDDTGKWNAYTEKIVQ